MKAINKIILAVLTALITAGLIGWVSFVTTASMHSQMHGAEIRRLNEKIERIDQSMNEFLFKKTFELAEKALIKGGK